MPEPTIVIEGETVRLPEGLAGSVPTGMEPSGTAILLLKGINQETANIVFEDCPAGPPDTGCLPNHRGPTATGPVMLLGQPVTRIEAEFMMPYCGPSA